MKIDTGSRKQYWHRIFSLLVYRSMSLFLSFSLFLSHTDDSFGNCNPKLYPKFPFIFGYSKLESNQKNHNFNCATCTFFDIHFGTTNKSQSLSQSQAWIPITIAPDTFNLTSQHQFCVFACVYWYNILCISFSVSSVSLSLSVFLSLSLAPSLSLSFHNFPS